MSRTLEFSRQRLVALGLLAACIAVVLAALLGPLTAAVHSQLEQRHLLVREIGKLQSLHQAEPELRKLVDGIDAHPLWQRTYRGDGIGGAQAALQKDFRALVEAQGITVDTLQPLDSVPAGPFTAMSLRVGFNTTIDHFGQLLAAMEAAPHALWFTNLYVTSPMSQNGAGNAPLLVRGDVLAYFDSEAAQ